MRGRVAAVTTVYTVCALLILLYRNEGVVGLGISVFGLGVQTKSSYPANSHNSTLETLETSQSLYPLSRK